MIDRFICVLWPVQFKFPLMDSKKQLLHFWISLNPGIHIHQILACLFTYLHRRVKKFNNKLTTIKEWQSLSQTSGLNSDVSSLWTSQHSKTHPSSKCLLMKSTFICFSQKLCSWDLPHLLTFLTWTPRKLSTTSWKETSRTRSTSSNVWIMGWSWVSVTMACG